MTREATSDGAASDPGSLGNPQFELLFAAQSTDTSARARHRRQCSMGAELSPSDFEPISGGVKESTTETIRIFRQPPRTPRATASPVVTIDQEIKAEILAKAESEFRVGRFHVRRPPAKSIAAPPSVVEARPD
jgi:hypothetical protein